MKTLLLDVDGVLVTPPEPFSSTLMQRHPEALHAFFHGPFVEASIGRADLRDHLPALLDATAYAGDVDAFLHKWFRFEHHLNAPLIETVQALRATGWRVYLATNQERHRLAYLLSEMGLDQLVDGEFSSCTVGIRKPDPAYFAEVGRRLNAAPHELVYWDDAPANVEAAHRAGWSAHVYTDVPDFQQLMSLGSARP